MNESQLIDYDAAGRLRRACWTATTCNATNQTVWAYDQLGRRTTERIGNTPIVTYAYDIADQLSTTTRNGTVTTYGYNANGDQTTTGPTISTFNTARQTTSITTPTGAVTYDYDGNGNRSSSSVSGVTTRFDWDTVASGLPKVVSERSNGTVTRSYVYGLDVARITNGATSSNTFADPVGTITALVSPTGTIQPRI